MPRITLITTASPDQVEMRRFLLALGSYQVSSTYDMDLLVVDDLRLPMVDRLAAEFSGSIRIAVVRPERRGQLDASVQALACVGGDVAVTIDPDMYLNIPDIDAFLRKWRQGKQLVYGVRSVRTDVSRARLLMSKAFNFMVRAVFGVPVRDINTPMLLLSADIIPDILKYDGRRGLVKVYFPHVLADRFDEVEIHVVSDRKVSAYTYAGLLAVALSMLFGLARFAGFRLGAR